MIDKNNLLAPLIKTLDKVILGIDEPQETEKKRNEFIEIDTEEEFDVERSIN
jgi:hypothetical protein